MECDYVTVAGGSRKGGAGRWHLDPECWAMVAPKRARRVPLAVAEAQGRWQCPYCAPRPPCCVTGDHTSTALTPMVPLAPAEMPEWEREMLADQEAFSGDMD